MRKKYEAGKSENVSCETSGLLQDKTSDIGQIQEEYKKRSWAEARCSLGIWKSGYLLGDSAKLFRSIWDYLFNEFTLHGYTEIILNSETEPFPAVLRLGFSSDALPIKYICQKPGYFAEIQAVFQEKEAAEWIGNISGDLERFLFQLNVPFRSARLDPQKQNALGNGQWRLDMWMPEKQEYLEFCRIGCSKQNDFEFQERDNVRGLWTGKVENISGKNLFAAVSENGYDPKKGIQVPSVLIPYMMMEWITV